MRKIDINTWDRRQTFLFFKGMEHPIYSMTFELDVTKFYEFVKNNHLSFYFSFMHKAIKVMNGIENFRYRFIDAEPCVYDSVHPSFTDNVKDTNLFKIVTVDYNDNLLTFINEAKSISDKQGDQFIDFIKERRQDLVYVTTFPWATYTDVSFAHHHDSYDAIPRLTWGKFKEVENKKLMPFTIAVHHAFVDGYHVGLYIQWLQAMINQAELS